MFEALLQAARPALAPALTLWGSPLTWLEIVAFVLALLLMWWREQTNARMRWRRQAVAPPAQGAA